MSWRARFDALIRELNDHPDIQVHTAELGAPATAEAIAAAEAFLGHALPDDVAAFYREMDGARVSWSHSDARFQNLGAHGSIRVMDVAAVFRADWASDGYGSKPFLPFDWPQDEYYAGFDSSLNIHWVHDPGSEGREMTGTTFAGYLDALLEARGWSFWQAMALYDESRASSLGATVEESEGRMQAILPRLFGAFDVAKVGNAGACPSADVSMLDEGEAIIAYRVSDLPEALGRMVPAEAGPRRCLFWVARPGSRTLGELFDEIPEPELDHVAEGLSLASAVVVTLASSPALAELLRPDEVPKGGRLTGGSWNAGFHTADGELVERWLRERGVRLLPVSAVLDTVQLLDVRDPAGDPVCGLTYESRVMNPGSCYDLSELAPGLYAIDREDSAFDHFDLFADGVESGFEVRRADLVGPCTVLTLA